MNSTSCRFAACVLVIGLSSCGSTPKSPPAAAEEPQVEAAAATTPAPARADVKTLEFKIEIAAPVHKVWDTMLSQAGYRKWTAPFMEGGYFEGSWAEGERMHFLAPGGSGMVAVIATNRPQERLSIKHIGFVMNGVEDTTSDAVRSWAPAYENYRFAAIPGGTEVTVEQDALAGMDAYMNDVWPKALAALKSLCETH